MSEVVQPSAPTHETEIVLTDIRDKLANLFIEKKTSLNDNENMLIKQIAGFGRQLMNQGDRQRLHGYKQLYFAGVRNFSIVLSSSNIGERFGNQIEFDSAVWPHYYSHCLVNGVPASTVELKNLKLGDVITLKEDAPVAKGFADAEVEKI